MKCLKEPLARLANFQDKTHGFFFEGRFKSVAILDEESLLATCAYIDLNPVAAGIAEIPETSPHTSVKERVDHAKAQGRTEDLKAACKGSVPGSKASAGLEELHWLCPMEDRRRIDSTREGMLEGFSLGSYLLLVDYSGRLFREGKVLISQEVAEMFERIGTTAETWGDQKPTSADAPIPAGFLARPLPPAWGPGDNLSPLVGEIKWGGTCTRGGSHAAWPATPHLNPPAQGGRRPELGTPVGPGWRVRKKMGARMTTKPGALQRLFITPASPSRQLEILCGALGHALLLLLGLWRSLLGAVAARLRTAESHLLTAESAALRLVEALSARLTVSQNKPVAICAGRAGAIRRLVMALPP
jgi:hypothetical protein